MSKKEITLPLPGFSKLLDGISQSSLKTFLTCRRKWILTQAGLSSPNTLKNTFFGSLSHEMLDLYYRTEWKDQPMTIEELEVFFGMVADGFITEDHKMVIGVEQVDIEKYMAIALVSGYVVKFGDSEKESFAQVYPEQEFSQVYNGWTLRGKIDGVVQLGDGSAWQLEHKTKSRIDEEGITTTLQFDFQNLFYCFVLEELMGTPIKGIVYNVLRKPALRRGKTETPKEFVTRVREDIIARQDWYFMRYEVIYSKRDKAQFKKNLDDILQEVDLFLEGGLADVQNPAHCLTPFTCTFLDVCYKKELGRLVTRETLFPELDAVIKTFPEIISRYIHKKPIIRRK